MNGDDKEIFELTTVNNSPDVYLKFKNSPDYEDPKSKNGTNCYQIRVKETSKNFSQNILITLLNKEENTDAGANKTTFF